MIEAFDKLRQVVFETKDSCYIMTSDNETRDISFYESLMVETAKAPNRAHYKLWQLLYERSEEAFRVKISMNGRTYSVPEFCFGTTLWKLAGINNLNELSCDGEIAVLKSDRFTKRGILHYQLLRLVDGDVFTTKWFPLPGG